MLLNIEPAKMLFMTSQIRRIVMPYMKLLFPGKKYRRPYTRAQALTKWLLPVVNVNDMIDVPSVLRDSHFIPQIRTSFLYGLSQVALIIQQIADIQEWYIFQVRFFLFTMAEIDFIVLFRCDCDPGYTGLLCNEEINECASAPCQNGATCVDLIDAFSCDCVNGYTGSY